MTHILILDGGLGTSLEDLYGIEFGQDTPLWSSHLLVSKPDTLTSCEKDFGRVPVDILLTATYQVSIEGFAHTKTPSFPNGIPQHEIVPFLTRAVSIAEEAKAPAATVALSIGPYGAIMVPSQEYSGVYDSEHSSMSQLLEWHHNRLMTFDQVQRLRTRVGYVAFETIPRLDEIRAIRQLVAQSPPSFMVRGEAQRDRIPYWISCVFPGDELALPDGTSIDQVVEAILSTEILTFAPWGIGINCTKVTKIPELVRRYEDAVSKLASAGHISSRPSLVLYPDGTNGETYDTTTQTWRTPGGSATPMTPWTQQLADVVNAASKRGCWEKIVVGGCCKATPNDISSLREKLSRI